MFRHFESQSISQLTEQICLRLENPSQEMLTGGYLTGSDNDTVDSSLESIASNYDGRIVVVDSTFQIIKDTYNVDTGRTLIAQEVIRLFKNGGTTSRLLNQETGFLEILMPIGTDTADVQGIMLISVPTVSIRNARRSLSRSVWLAELILIILVIGTAFYASDLIVGPFRKVTGTLKQQTVSPDTEISIPDYTETQLLAEAYNEMRQRMETQEQARQEFVSNVSHELKTPLTSMKVLADSLLSQPDVPNELYREFMQDMSEEIDRENKIITDLLSLVKMDRKSADLNVKETNINDLIDLILKRLRPIAAKSNVELVLENYKPILAEVDETKLTLAISNLVENAIKYNNPEGGWVHVSLNMDGVYCYVKVEDSGIGIPKEQQPFIFERFYRVDKSHSREIGGTGLGLAITRSVVRMHHGELRVHSNEGVGSTFTIRLPLRYIPDAAVQKGNDVKDS